MEIFRMDTKSEKLALFRFALIAPLVIEGSAPAPEWIEYLTLRPLGEE
jgi:hypothetical protein